MFLAVLMINIFLLKMNTDTKDMLINLLLIKNFINLPSIYDVFCSPVKIKIIR